MLKSYGLKQNEWMRFYQIVNRQGIYKACQPCQSSLRKTSRSFATLQSYRNNKGIILCNSLYQAKFRWMDPVSSKTKWPCQDYPGFLLDDKKVDRPGSFSFRKAKVYFPWLGYKASWLPKHLPGSEVFMLCSRVRINPSFPLFGIHSNLPSFSGKIDLGDTYWNANHTLFNKQWGPYPHRSNNFDGGETIRPSQNSFFGQPDLSGKITFPGNTILTNLPSNPASKGPVLKKAQRYQKYKVLKSLHADLPRPAKKEMLDSYSLAFFPERVKIKKNLLPNFKITSPLFSVGTERSRLHNNDGTKNNLVSYQLLSNKLDIQTSAKVGVKSPFPSLVSKI